MTLQTKTNNNMDEKTSRCTAIKTMGMAAIGERYG